MEYYQCMWYFKLKLWRLFKRALEDPHLAVTRTRVDFILLAEKHVRICSFILKGWWPMTDLFDRPLEWIMPHCREVNKAKKRKLQGCVLLHEWTVNAWSSNILCFWFGVSVDETLGNLAEGNIWILMRIKISYYKFKPWTPWGCSYGDIRRSADFPTPKVALTSITRQGERDPCL